MASSTSTSMTNSTTVNSQNPNNEFIFFSRLPKELRCHIWQYTYPRARKIYIEKFINDCQFRLSEEFSKGQTPVAFRVNHEALVESKANYFRFNLCHKQRNGDPRLGGVIELEIAGGELTSPDECSLHFHAKNDILCIEARAIIWGCRFPEVSRLMFENQPRFLSSIENLELFGIRFDEGFFNSFLLKENLYLRWFLSKLCQIKTVKLIEYDCQYSKELPRVYKSRKWWAERILELLASHVRNYKVEVTNVMIERSTLCERAEAR